ncbi:MAG: hypothetical protein JNL90_06230 [Planctomycetes bacterium]|nr:hypothetical protein [Planctomycetota bacterium]
MTTTQPADQAEHLARAERAAANRPLSRRAFAWCSALLLACAALVFRVTFRASNERFLLALLVMPTLFALLLVCLGPLFLSEGAGRRRALAVLIGLFVLPVAGGFAGAGCAKLDFRWRRRTLYLGLVERIERGELLIEPGSGVRLRFAEELAETLGRELEDAVISADDPGATGDDPAPPPRLALLDESFRDAAIWIDAVRALDGSLALDIYWARSGPPPAHHWYLYRSDGVWPEGFDCDWARRIDDRFFECGDS